MSRNNFNNNAYRGNFNPRTFPGNSTNNYNNRNTSDLENNIKEFTNTQKVFNAAIEEKLNKIDDMSKSIDRISHDVENLKMKTVVPKVEELKLYMFLWMKVRKELLCLELKENF